MAEDEPQTALVVDCGSDTCKIGFANQEQPSLKIPSIIGRADYKGAYVSKDMKEHYIGNDALSKRGLLKLRYPIENRFVTDWEGVEKILHDAFYNELTVAVEDHPMMITEAPLNPKGHREKMTELLFETFQVPAMYLAMQPVLALYASGRTTGSVLDSGHGATHVVPVYEGYALPHAILHTHDVAGSELTNYLLRLINERGCNFTTSKERDCVREMKEKLCYLSSDFQEEVSSASSGTSLDKEFVLPDGKSITVRVERFQCPEAMMQPTFLGFEKIASFHELIYHSITKCSQDILPDLFKNIVFTGGNTLFTGMPERLQNELDALLSFYKKAAPRTLPKDKLVAKITAPKDRLYSAWQGGATLASLSAFQQMWVTKQDYEDTGPTIVHRKCF